MESLSNILQPHKDIVATLASYLTIGQFLAPAAILVDIYKQKSVKGFAVTPFMGGTAIGILMLVYGQMLNDSAMITVNYAAVFLNTIYLLVYYLYTENKWEEFFKPMSYAVALVAVLLGYVQVEAKEDVEFRYGLILTILMLALIGSPLMDVSKIIEKRDASSIPLPMTFMGAIVTFLWFLYGIILKNTFMVVQNVIAFILCLVQLVLIFMYPKREHQD